MEGMSSGPLGGRAALHPGPVHLRLRSFGFVALSGRESHRVASYSWLGFSFHLTCSPLADFVARFILLVKLLSLFMPWAKHAQTSSRLNDIRSHAA